MSNNDQAIIRLEDVHKSFGRQKVLDGIDLEIRQGETTVIIGPSGCGKTVLIKHMIALLRPDSGQVWYRDQKISSMSERHLSQVRMRYGFVFQGGALFDSMTVAENICFPLKEHGIGTTEEHKTRCQQVLNMVGLGDTKQKLPGELSGGQKKRVALARAIVMDPEIILYDEPTTGLDPVRSDLINELVMRLKDAMGVTSVVVTHDMASARKVADRIVMLHRGNLIVDTTPERISQIDNDVVSRFVQGRASDEELAEVADNDLPSLQDTTSG